MTGCKSLIRCYPVTNSKQPSRNVDLIHFYLVAFYANEQREDVFVHLWHTIKIVNKAIIQTLFEIDMAKVSGNYLVDDMRI